MQDLVRMTTYTSMKGDFHQLHALHLIDVSTSQSSSRDDPVSGETENTYDVLVLGSSLRCTADGGGAVTATSLARDGRLRLLRLARSHSK